MPPPTAHIIAGSPSSQGAVAAAACGSTGGSPRPEFGGWALTAGPASEFRFFFDNETVILFSPVEAI